MNLFESVPGPTTSFYKIYPYRGVAIEMEHPQIRLNSINNQGNELFSRFFKCSGVEFLFIRWSQLIFSVLGSLSREYP